MHGRTDGSEDPFTVLMVALDRVARRWHVPPWELAAQPHWWNQFGAALVMAEAEQPEGPQGYSLQQIAGPRAHLLGGADNAMALGI